MPRLHLALFSLILVLLAACATPAAQPTAELTPITPATPTPGPDEPVSSTPEEPILEEPPVMSSPYQPQPDDAKLQRGQAFVESAQVIVAESFPPQFFLSLMGSLPTPCHQLRIVTGNPDGRHRINIDVYSVVDPNQACTQVLEPFNVNVPLGKLPSGKYEVWVNNQPAGEIEAP